MANMFDLTQEAEAEGGIGRVSSKADVVQASFVEGIHSAETSSIFRMIELHGKRAVGPEINHKDLNKQYKLPIPLNQPTTQAAFDVMVARDQESIKRREIISNGAPGLITSVSSFASAMVPQMLDPIGLASSVVIGGGVVSMFGKAAKFGSVAKAASKSKLAVGVTEGVVGNLVSEAAFVLPASAQEQQDVDTYESLRNASIGGIAFPLVTSAFRKSFSMLKGSKNSDELMGKVGEYAKQQMDAGKKVDVDDMRRALEKENLVELKEEMEFLEGIRENFSGEKLDEIDSTIRSIGEDVNRIEGENFEPTKLREKANSEQEDLYHDPEIAIEKAEIESRTEMPDIAGENRVAINNVVDEVELLDRRGILEEAEKTELETVKTNLDQADNMEDIMDAIESCARSA